MTDFVLARRTVFAVSGGALMGSIMTNDQI